MEVEEDHDALQLFDLQVSQNVPSIQLCEAEHHHKQFTRKTASEYAQESNELDHILYTMSSRKSGRKHETSKMASHAQWMNMIEAEIYEIRTAIYQLKPENSKSGPLANPLFRLIRKVEKDEHRRKRKISSNKERDTQIPSLVEKIRRFFIHQVEVKTVKINERKWFSTTDIIKWVETDDHLQGSSMLRKQQWRESQERNERDYQQQREMPLRKIDHQFTNKQYAAFRARVSDALEIMEAENLIVKHALTSTFVRPTEKIFSDKFSVNSMYEEAMNLAVMLKKHRDILERKVEHLSYLLDTIRIVRDHTFNKQIEAEQINPEEKLVLPLLMIRIPKTKHFNNQIVTDVTRSKVFVASRRQFQMYCDTELIHMLKDINSEGLEFRMHSDIDLELHVEELKQ